VYLRFRSILAQPKLSIGVWTSLAMVLLEGTALRS
jgi:hypothetical protein